ncbi:MAG TPA: iron-containing redox enzyme family protein, partial [Caulobacteraceae bacterium]|nr:iron-containing redox enzyme family protein [Caulobacteraceae bacterium]
MLQLEGGWIEAFREQVAPAALAAPQDPDRFIEWFEDLKSSGPGQDDPLFPWLARDATRAEMTWFLTQEAAGEAGFEDLVAMTQVKIPAPAKLELARN